MTGQVNNNIKTNQVKHQIPPQQTKNTQSTQSSVSAWDDYKVNNGGQYSVKMSTIANNLTDNVMMKIIDSNKDGKIGEGDTAVYTDKKGVEQKRPVLETKALADSSSQDSNNNPVALSLGTFDDKGSVDKSKGSEKFVTSFGNIRQGNAVLNFEEKNVTTSQFTEWKKDGSQVQVKKECLTGEAKAEEMNAANTTDAHNTAISAAAKEVKKNNAAIDAMARKSGEDSTPILNNLFNARSSARETAGRDSTAFRLADNAVKSDTTIIKSPDDFNTEVSGLTLKAARIKIEKPALEQMAKAIDTKNISDIDLRGFSKADFE